MGDYFFQKPGILKESSSGYDHVLIDEELMLSREVFLVEDVNVESMNALFMKILYLYRQAPEEEITIYINSPGGDVLSGMAVVDLIKMIPTPVKTICAGIAASMGAVIFLAGDKREMMPNSRLMIHDPSTGGSMDGMKPAEIEQHLNHLKKVQEMLAGHIAERTGKTVEEVLGVTANDTYFDAKEAVDFGLATGIVTAL